LKVKHTIAAILLLLSSSVLSRSSIKECGDTQLPTYVKTDKSFDFAQACSAVETAIKFAKEKSFLVQDTTISIKYKKSSTNGYEFPNNFNKSATNYSQVISNGKDLIEMSSFYSEDVHSTERSNFGLNVHTSNQYSERQRVMILTALHHSVIVHETIHVLLNSYLKERPSLKLSYGEKEAIAYIGQLESISPSLRKIIIDLNQDILDRNFGYQDLVNHIENENDQDLGINAFYKYTNGSLKVKELLRL